MRALLSALRVALRHWRIIRRNERRYERRRYD